jgi:hypothetical protein
MAPVTYHGGLHDLKVVSEDENGKEYEPDIYNGFDHAAGQPVTIEAGQHAEVSEEMAARVVEDFPEHFSAGTDGKPASSKQKHDDGDRRAQLLAHDRGELNGAAAALGIEEPEKLPNKGAVADAILAKADEQATRAQLQGRTRDELNALAAEAGVDGADQLDDDALADAIAAKATA